MTDTIRLRAVAISLLGMCDTNGPARAAEPPAKSNVVVILADDHGYFDSTV